MLIASRAAAQLPPDGRWLALETAHFRVTFADGLEPFARRAADRAERAYSMLTSELIAPPRGKVELVLTDNVDYANGIANIIPRNRIVVYAHPPIDNPELAFYQEWLDLVILHELVHIFHLDTSRGIWAKLRLVLGREPGLFSSATSPDWLTEGLATYLESRLTGAGRVYGSIHDMMLRTAVLEDAFFPIDRVSGTPTTWPASGSSYVYGSLFVDYLAGRYGFERISDFIEVYAGRLIPYRLQSTSERVFGAELTTAWADWERGLRASYQATFDSVRASGATEPEILTRAGRIASFPRYSATGALAYVAASGVDEPSIRQIAADGSETVVVDRTAGSAFGWGPDGSWLVYGDLQYAGPYRVYSDLRTATLDGGERRLTRSARITEPDVHPDGSSVVAVANAGATNVLIVRDIATGETRQLTTPELDVHWALPRWSPSGDRIAAVRWVPGGLRDVVVLDGAGTLVREITRDRAVDAAPAWTPDGRRILFASDRGGISNLYAAEVESGSLSQVTNVLTGAFEPTVSPDGQWIAFSYYRSDGYHIARIPFDTSSWRSVPAPRPELEPLVRVVDHQATAGGATRSYSPWPSLAPTSWSPYGDSGSELGIGGGFVVGGKDVIERHIWEASIFAYPEDVRVEAGATYRYRGLGNPVLDFGASQNWRVAATRDAQGDTLPTALLERERQLTASLLWVRRRWTSSASFGLGGELSNRDREWDDPGQSGDFEFAEPPAEVAGVAQATFSSARAFGLSVGPQQGASVTLRGEGHRYLDAFAGDSDPTGYLRFTARGRQYQPLWLTGFARHVLALRLDLGAETGSRSPGLRVGGVSGSGLSSTLGLPVDVNVLGRSVGFPIRGYGEGAQRGNRAAIATAEYRFPILRIERGYHLVPLFLERVTGDVFADAGAAWCAGPCPDDSPNGSPSFTPLSSVGGEILVDLTLGFRAELPLRFGVALPLRGQRTLTGYVSVGRGF